MCGVYSRTQDAKANAGCRGAGEHVVNPWYAKAAVLAASIAMVVIRAPHGSRSRQVKVVRSRKGTLEVVLPKRR